MMNARKYLVLGIAASCSCITALLVACQSTGKTAGETATNPATLPWIARTNASQLGGAELWSQTCSRCHNLRSPSTYGPHQWDVAMYDMRVRANLTGEEQRKILEFLKAASQ